MIKKWSQYNDLQWNRSRLFQTIYEIANELQ